MEVAVRQISGTSYRIGPLDAYKQVHILRRLGPALVAAIPALMELLSADEDMPAEEKAKNAMKKVETVLGSLPSLMDAFSRMKDEDAEYVINAALNVCAIQQATGYAMVRANGVLMVQTITMPVMMQLTWLALKENMQGYFPTEEPTASAPPLPAQS
jgi:hypothetical protein